MADSENEFGLFTEEEMALKGLIRKNRFDVINALTVDGVPSDNSTIRILNEVMSAADNEIVETAKLRHSVKVAKDDSHVKQLMLNLLSSDQSFVGMDGNPNANREVVEVDVIPTAITEGKELYIEDYIGDEDENNDDDL